MSVDGLDFVSDGKIVKHRCLTAFTMWQLACDGEWGQIDDYLGWGLGLGFTDYRAFGCWGNTNFLPLGLAIDAWQILDDLEIRMNQQGARLKLCAFTDQVNGSPVLMDSESQRAHWDNCVDVMSKRKTGKLSVVNEYRKNWKEPYPLPFTYPDFKGVVGMISTWYDGHDPQEQGKNINFVSKHTGGFDEEWSRKSKVCVEAQKGQGGGLGEYPPAWKPCIVGERCRIAEGSTPREHADSSALEEAMGSGGCVHGGFHANVHDSLLQRCLIPTHDVAIACVHAAAATFNAIPPYIASNWVYGNSGGGIIQHDDNLMLRTYVMQEGNKAYVIRVKGRKPGMPIRPMNGWQVKQELGYESNIVYCER